MQKHQEKQAGPKQAGQGSTSKGPDYKTSKGSSYAKSSLSYQLWSQQSSQSPVPHPRWALTPQTSSSSSERLEEMKNLDEGDEDLGYRSCGDPDPR